MLSSLCIFQTRTDTQVKERLAKERLAKERLAKVVSMKSKLMALREERHDPHSFLFVDFRGGEMRKQTSCVGEFA